MRRLILVLGLAGACGGGGGLLDGGPDAAAADAGAPADAPVEPDGATADAPTADAADAVDAAEDAAAELDASATNVAPAAVDDFVATGRDTARNVAVLDNDRDADADALVVVLVGAPLHGTATIEPAGLVNYTPAAGFVGLDRFTYSVADGQGGMDSGTVRVVVTRPGGAAIVRVSVGAAGTQADAASFSGPQALSLDGSWVVFETAATNLVSGGVPRYVLARELTTGELVRLDQDGNAAPLGASSSGAASADASTVVFERVPGNEQLWLNAGSGAVSVCAASDGTAADRACRSPALDADGLVIAFVSAATNLVAGDDNERTDVFVRELASGATSRVSVGAAGAQASDDSGFFNTPPALSADARWVAFESEAGNLVAGDGDTTRDVFVHDRETGATERVGQAGQGTSISGDGRFVAFVGDGAGGVQVRDRRAGGLAQIHVGTGGAPADGAAHRARISADGRFVVFTSSATNLVPDDTNGARDVFVHDRTLGTTVRISVAADGAQGDADSGFGPGLFGSGPSISADGRYVAFYSFAANLVGNDANGAADVFVAPNPLAP